MPVYYDGKIVHKKRYATHYTKPSSTWHINQDQELRILHWMRNSGSKDGNKMKKMSVIRGKDEKAVSQKKAAIGFLQYIRL